MKIFFSFFTIVFGFTSLSKAQLILDQPNTQGDYTSPGSIILRPGFSTAPGQSFSARIVSYCTPLAAAPSSNQNYILTRVFKTPGVSELTLGNGRTLCEENQTIQYFDGLGRPIQTVTVQGSPGFNDLVQPMTYDAFGREDKKYLPYAATGNNGAYRADALTALNTFYNPSPGGSSGGSLGNGIARIPTPFAETRFEASPLNRVEEQGSPGDPWQLSSGHTVKMVYSSNDASQVKRWTVAANGASAGTYVAGSLYQTISKDENWTSADGRAGTVEEFKDLDGRIVLKRTWETDTKSLSTYYVYDDLGNLRYVLPPTVNENGQATVDSFTEADAVFQQFIYGYHYDGRKRLTAKKVPGKGWELMVYNPLDQLVLSQDALQRNRTPQQWTYSKYNALGRLVISGIYEHVGSGAASSIALDFTNRNALQAVVNGQGTPWENRDNTNTVTSYTNTAFPTSNNSQVLTINYYDDYGFAGNTFGGPEAGTEQVEANRTRGLLTGSKKLVLGSETLLLTTNYYDQEGRLLRSKSQNHLNGTDVIDNIWDFPGQLTGSTRTHTVGGTSTTIANTYTYDHLGRKILSKEKINGQGEVVLSKMVYNEVGQLMNKSLHSTDQGVTFLQSTGYAYNERGWLKNTSSGEFSMQLNYNDAQQATPQYNGNISNQLWGTSSSLGSTFNYSYDKLNRLTSAAATGLGESISYDVMGNITSMTRDNFGTNTYSGYNGNQLTGISGFTNSNYEYDLNGNMTRDSGKDINLSYNLLNLPSGVSGSQKMSYTYDATGNKLKRTAGNEITDYVGGIQYKNGAIEFVQTEVGIARNHSGSYSYEYNLSDHLGNNRATFYQNPDNHNLEVLQRDDYYAFGLRKGVQGGNNQYLYNGKELQDQLGQYDYGARFYDPVIGRWNVIDALAENHHSVTPYNYVLNNPINTIDPFGLDTVKANQVTPEVWHNFNTSGDNIALNEVSITATRGASKAQAAYSSVQSEVQSNYRKQSGGLFMGYPDNLQGRVNSTFHERYIAHNEINPFSGQGRVVGLEDANWIIDLAVGGIYSLTKTGAAVASERAGISVLGHYPDYVNLANQLGARRFTIPSNIWNNMSYSEQWIANQKFLDRMILRGDNIRLATPITSVKPGSFYQTELNYLFGKGYNVSSDGLWLK